MVEFKFDVAGLPEKVYEKGTLLLVEGERSGKVMVLKQGTLSVQSGGIELVKISEPKTIFGEISVLLESEHSATVLAETKVTVYVIENLLEFVKANPLAAMYVAQVLANRLVNMNQHIIAVRNEVVKLQREREKLTASATAAAAKAENHSVLYKLVTKVDRFWSTDVI